MAAVKGPAMGRTGGWRRWEAARHAPAERARASITTRWALHSNLLAFGKLLETGAGQPAPPYQTCEIPPQEAGASSGGGGWKGHGKPTYNWLSSGDWSAAMHRHMLPHKGEDK